MADQYFMLSTDHTLKPGRSLAGDTVEDETIAADPRRLELAEIFIDQSGPVTAAEVLAGALHLLTLTPAGRVKEKRGTRFVYCPAGWTIRTVAPPAAALGPQAPQLLHAMRTAERVLAGERDSTAATTYKTALDALYDDPTVRVAVLADRASTALDTAGADGFWWDRIAFPCGYGLEMLALAARDLIGTVPGWDRAAYDALTYAWSVAFGPIHPGDKDTVEHREGLALTG